MVRTPAAPSEDHTPENGPLPPHMTLGAIFTMSRSEPANRRRPSSRQHQSLLLAVAAILAAVVPAGIGGAATTDTSNASTTTTPAVHVSSLTPFTPALSPASSTVSAYWVVARDGGIFAFGGAPFYGSTGNIHLNQPIVGMAATSPNDFGGYREVASDGGVFSYGDAAFYGSTGNIHLNQPIVGMAATSDGRGYWLVASDGGIFAYGDAQFVGSTGNLKLTEPIVSMSATHSNQGYLLAAADGGFFAFGDAQFHGSLGGIPQSRRIVGMTSSADGGGYWSTNDSGAVTAFGDATYWGSAPQVLAAPVVGIAEAAGNGSFIGTAYPSGSFGYDISNWQCGAFPPTPHTISIVEVNGASFGSTNSCLADEAKWAGAGLNLYTFLTYGQVIGSNPACSGSSVPDTCNFGYNAGIDAFTKAQGSGVNTNVHWWLDVEPATPAWSSYQAANAALVEGYLAALRAEGVSFVGIYTSPLTWSGIVGSYAPALPLWLAWYTGDPNKNCLTGYTGAASYPYTLPTGGVVLTQYGIGTINGNQYDQDYAC